MKRLFIVVLACVATVVGVYAQGQTATLQQGDVLTPFYGADAFKDAYAAAKAGAVITLSSGEFNALSSGVAKQISIIGNGCVDTESTSSTQISELSIKASNLRIEGIKFSMVTIDANISDLHLNHCYIKELKVSGSFTHKNTVIDQCYLEKDWIIPQSENSCYKNTFIEFFFSRVSNEIIYYDDTTHPAYFCNCLIYCWAYWEKNGSKTKYSLRQPVGIYKNCILGTSYMYEQGPVSFGEWNRATQNSPNLYEYYNNVWFRYTLPHNEMSEHEEYKTIELSYCSEVLDETQTHKGGVLSTWAELFDEDATNWWEWIKADIPFKGDDGKVVGPYGGTGFSINPSVPRIVESKIDSNTDADGKLNVRIKVEASGN